MYSLLLCFSILITYTVSTALEPRIFNGDELRPNVHKYLVRLRLLFTNGDYFCSGSVLRQNWIISSALCFSRDVIFLSVEQDVEQIQRLVAIGRPSEIITYLDYHFHHDMSLENIEMVEKDLALLKMAMKMEFDEWLQPIPLSVKSVSIGQEVIITGYGKTETGKSAPREGSTVVAPCSYGSGYKLICTNSVVKSGNGDSGGALVSNGHLVGVTSGGCKGVSADRKCESVHVAVAEHIAWINAVIDGS